MPTFMVSNTRYLRNKMEEFQYVLQENNIQVAIVSETWFTPEQPEEMSNIDGFTLFSKPRPIQTGGGVAIYVCDKFYARKLEIEVPPELECTWIFTRPPRLPREVTGLAVCAVYLPPGSPHQELLHDHLVETVDHLRTKYADIGICIGGDFNRMDVKQLCTCTNMKQIVNIPTRQDAILDLIITNLGRFYKPCSTIAPVGMSDHRTVIVTPKQHTQSNVVRKKTVRPMPDSRVRSFGTWITSHDWSEVASKEGSQAMTTAFYSTLHQKMDEHFPTRRIKLHIKDKPWMTPAIKALLSKRQKAFVAGKTNKWKALRNKTQSRIKRARQSFYKSKVQNLKKLDPANWHDEIRSMANIGKTSPTISVEGIAVEDTKATADAINVTLSNITKALPPLDTTYLPAFLPSPMPPQIKVWEMYNKLSNIRVGKAAGPDNVTGRLTKEFACELSTPLTWILNASLAEGRVPWEWREATVIPLAKTKPPSVNELRPVSLTSLLAKVCESFVAEHILKDITPNIDAKQFGGLPGRSTTHCLVDIMHLLYKNSDRTGTVSGPGPDRLFQSVRPCRPHHCRNTSVRPRVQTSSRTVVMRFLVRETTTGSVSGNTLRMGGLNMRAAQNSVSHHWKFVDDLNLIETKQIQDQSSLQRDLSDLESWTEESKMKLHPKKCKVMHFCFTRIPPTLPSVQIDGHVLQTVQIAKLLGVWIQTDLKWDTQVNHMSTQGSKRLFILKRLKQFNLPTTDLTAVYTTYVRPVLEYAAPEGMQDYPGEKVRQLRRRLCTAWSSTIENKTGTAVPPLREETVEQCAL
ncbi:hypothetical protein Bbelb_037060 [Branchiostoma belcheri]|nr:hypothetical protein Bbelb_037060 [Branchiostoma belcheri]